MLCVDADWAPARADVGGPPVTTVRVSRDTATVPAGRRTVRVELRQGGRLVLSASGDADVRAPSVGSDGCEQQVRTAALRYDRASGTLVPA